MPRSGTSIPPKPARDDLSLTHMAKTRGKASSSSKSSPSTTSAPAKAAKAKASDAPAKKKASAKATPKVAKAPSASPPPSVSPRPKAGPAPKPVRKAHKGPRLKRKTARIEVPGETADTRLPWSVREAEALPVPVRAADPTDEAKRLFAIDAARLLHDDKCTEIVVLDVRALSAVADFIVIGSGTSDRQMGSVLAHVRAMGEERGMPAWRTSEDDGSLWLLADLVDVVVHLFEPNTRSHYDLEMLWGDAPRVEWERPEEKPRDLAGLNTRARR